jgi:hypothetical protein
MLMERTLVSVNQAPSGAERVRPSGAHSRDIEKGTEHCEGEEAK